MKDIKKKDSAPSASNSTKKKSVALASEKPASWVYGKWIVVLGIAGSIASLIGLAVVFFPGTATFSNSTIENVETQTSFGSNQIDVVGDNNIANIDQSLGKTSNNLNNSVNVNNLSINSGGTATVVSNSNNRNTNLNKTVNFITTNNEADQKPKDNSERLSLQQTGSEEIPAVKVLPKKVAVKSPEVYKLIRERSISGDEFELQQLTWQLTKLREIGQTLDFSDASQGILMAREWLETCSVLAGQTDVWLSKNFVESLSNRNLFDGAKVSTNQSNELEFIKSTIALKVKTLKYISERFAASVEEVRQKRKARITYGVKINQSERNDSN